jgi:hypothetical protein
LLECGILLLRTCCYGDFSGYELYIIVVFRSLRWVEKPTAVPATIGKSTDRAAFSKIVDGSVREGI